MNVRSMSSTVVGTSNVRRLLETYTPAPVTSTTGETWRQQGRKAVRKERRARRKVARPARMPVVGPIGVSTSHDRDGTRRAPDARVETPRSVPLPGMAMIKSGYFRWGALVALVTFSATAGGAQSLTGGALAGMVVDEGGTPVYEAAVTLERDGAAFRTLTTDRAGRFVISLLAPGRYALLAEQIGFQPLRSTDVLVAAGRETRVTVRLVRRPPPIAAVDEQPALFTMSGAASGRMAAGREISGFDRRRDITDITRGMTEVDAPRNDQGGLLGSANGLGPRFTAGGGRRRGAPPPIGHARGCGPTPGFYVRIERW